METVGLTPTPTIEVGANKKTAPTLFNNEPLVESEEPKMREVTLTERVLQTPVQVPLQLLMKSVPSLRTSLIQVVSKTTQYDHVAQRAER